MQNLIFFSFYHNHDEILGKVSKFQDDIIFSTKVMGKKTSRGWIPPPPPRWRGVNGIIELIPSWIGSRGKINWHNAGWYLGEFLVPFQQDSLGLGHFWSYRTLKACGNVVCQKGSPSQGQSRLWSCLSPSNNQSPEEQPGIAQTQGGSWSPKLVMVNNVPVVKVWSNICLVHLVKNWARSESG